MVRHIINALKPKGFLLLLCHQAISLAQDEIIQYNHSTLCLQALRKHSDNFYFSQTENFLKAQNIGEKNAS